MNLVIKNNITPIQINKLIYYSNNDSDVLKFTHDSQRFKDLSSFNRWFGKDIQVFILTNESDELLGLIWIKLKLNELSKFIHTFAIRIYKPLRGKGYSYKFAKEVFEKLKIDGLWLSTHKDNLAALRLYEKLKFKYIGSQDDQMIMELDLSK